MRTTVIFKCRLVINIFQQTFILYGIQGFDCSIFFSPSHACTQWTLQSEGWADTVSCPILTSGIQANSFNRDGKWAGVWGLL